MTQPTETGTPAGAASEDAPAPSAAESPPPPEETPLLMEAAKRHRQLAKLLSKAPGDALKDPEFVHDVRVGARRLGETARLLRAFMDKPTAKAVDDSLRSLRQSMGELRDSDVTREHLLKWRMPAPVKQVARTIARELEEGRPILEQAAREKMTSASLGGAVLILTRALEERSTPDRAQATERSIHAAVTRQLKRREKKLRASFGKAALKQTAESLHAARIAVKKLRYVLEVAEAADAKGAKKKVAFLKRIQELLGEHHDVHVIEQQVQSHLKTAKTPAGKPIKNLAPAARKWRHDMEQSQARRAADFFAKSYQWLNSA